MVQKKKIQKNYSVNKANILVKCQENAWFDHNLFIYCLNNIWFAGSIKKSVNNSLLILELAITHFYKDLSKEFEKRNEKYALIPQGLTRFLQPLDFGINKEIKQYIRQAETEFRINNGNIKPPSENQIIDLFTNIW